ncbi:NADPH-dependent F420 reductase [Nocardia brasiliensis]|uniref:NADPH-dependent F420 reductase n=1 Tax=Nocardia brasiliensis TaxID=37326 RepID=UPI003D8AD9D1
MRIGIIGAGTMARALGEGWTVAGHEVMIGARPQWLADGLAGAIGRRAKSGTVAQAASFSDVVLLATPVSMIAEIVCDLDDVLADRILIDSTKADPSEVAVGGSILVEDIDAERLAALLPRTRVVKAFNLCDAAVWESRARLFGGRRLAVPICGDDPAAVRRVATLAEDLLLQPITIGGLRWARRLEAVAELCAELWSAGEDVRAMLPPVEASGLAPG